METRRPERPILLPIDAHGVSPAALEVVVRVARRLDRRLRGLIFENEKLRQVAALPFTTEIVLANGSERGLEWRELSRHHLRVVEVAQARLQALAEREHIELSIELVQGDRWPPWRDGGEPGDVFYPARQRWLAPVPRMPIPAPAITRLGIVTGPGSSDERIFAITGALCDRGMVGSVYVLAEQPPATDSLKPIAGMRGRVCVQSNFQPTPERLASLISGSAYDLLILSRARCAGLPPALLDAALEKAGGQVMVID